MLRVAKKINTKLKNSLIEIEKEIQRALELSNQTKPGSFHALIAIQTDTNPINFKELCTFKEEQQNPAKCEETGKSIILEDQATQTDDEDGGFSAPKGNVFFKYFFNLTSKERLRLLLGYDRERQYVSSNNIAETQNFQESLEMLPIFQRLIEDKKQKKKSAHVSCPNILLKCDIVEYLWDVKMLSWLNNSI